MEGIIFYYPFEGGRETKPTRFESKATEDDEEGAEEGRHRHSQHRDEDEEDNANADTSVFDVFWQRRLVPESKVSVLKFFPKNDKYHSMQNNLPEAWRGRLKGFLFFDASFRHISNNKLKIRVRACAINYEQTIFVIFPLLS